MLLQKPQTLPYTSVFKLASGEEFIGKVVDETITSYTISKPLCMVAADQGLRFAPFIMMGDFDEDLHLPKPVISTKPNKKILEQYEESTATIALPVKQSIIT